MDRSGGSVTAGQPSLGGGRVDPPQMQAVTPLGSIDAQSTASGDCAMADHGERGLSEKVVLVAGATRGAGRAIAVELGRAGAHVYATGRSSRLAGRSEIDRPETIEETGELVEA